MSLDLGMADLYDIFNSKNLSNFYPSSMDSLESCNISSIHINPLKSGYHFICKKCDEIPKIVSFKKDKIKLICSCQESPKEILIKNIFNHLIVSDDEISIPKKFRCSEHKNEKIYFFVRNVEKIVVINV